MRHSPPRGLYLLTPHVSSTAELLAVVAAALRPQVCLVQYRDKHATAAIRRERAQALLILCRNKQVPLVINDDLDLAAAVDADGVHLGRDDAGIEQARQQLGPQALIGASCYDDLGRAETAADAGASYVAFGAFYGSPTKPTATRSAPALLEHARARLDVPICAIGGITAANAGALISAGADLLAVCSSVFGADDPADAAYDLVQCFA